jgi:hypothetical protein
VVAATAGATGSFFAELARRAELLAATSGAARASIDHIMAALAELDHTRQSVARAVADARPPPNWSAPHPALAPHPGLAP